MNKSFQSPSDTLIDSLASSVKLSVFFDLVDFSCVSSFCSYHLDNEENDIMSSIGNKLSTNKSFGDFSSNRGAN